MSRWGPRIPAAPLAAAIARDAAAIVALAPDDTWKTGLAELERRTGIDQRILRRACTQRRVTTSLADRYCCATNRALALLYPDPDLPPAELVIARIPHRLRPALAERRGDAITPLAYFSDEGALRRYLELTQATEMPA